MPIRTNARRRARFSTRIRQVGVDVTGARLGESDVSSSIAGSLWYCALGLLASTHEHVPYVYLVLSDIRSLRFYDLGVNHADDAWNISARSVYTPATHRPTDWQVLEPSGGYATVGSRVSHPCRPKWVVHVRREQGPCNPTSAELATRHQQLVAGYVQYGT
jgi:hypothetical protein